jgi:hypothetical protein
MRQHAAYTEETEDGCICERLANDRLQDRIRETVAPRRSRARIEVTIRTAITTSRLLKAGSHVITGLALCAWSVFFLVLPLVLSLLAIMAVIDYAGAH